MRHGHPPPSPAPGPARPPAWWAPAGAQVPRGVLPLPPHPRHPARRQLHQARGALLHAAAHWQGAHRGEVLLVTHGDSASCFMQLHMNWVRTSFGWKILPVQNILIVPICQKCTFKKIPFHDFFIIFIVVTHGDFCDHFLCCSNKYCFFLFCLNIFSNLTFDGC